MKKVLLVFLICIVFIGFISLVHGAISRPDINEARVMSIAFERVKSGTPPIVLHLYGEIRDVNGKIKNVNKFYDWNELPVAWQTALLPTLKKISKAFNNEFAAEDTETF